MMKQAMKTGGIRRLLARGPGKRAAELTAWFLGGYLLSAAGTGEGCLSLSLGLLCAGRSGYGALAAAVGGAVGYWNFWGPAAIQGVFWLVFGLAVNVFLGDRSISDRQVLLLPACAALIVSASGVLFLLRFRDRTAVPMYLLRVALAMGSTLVFRLWLEGRGSWAEALAQGLLTFALAGVSVGGIRLGYALAGYIAAQGPLVHGVLAGLGLDLARPVPIGMTGALCLGFCLRMIPGKPKWADALVPTLAYLPMAALGGYFQWSAVPGLLLGGMVRLAVPGLKMQPKRRRGETAIAQLRLEQMAAALGHMEQSLLLTAPPAPDRAALLDRVQREACGLCPERRGCRGRMEDLSPELLEQPGLTEEDLPKGCRKRGRLLAEMRRGQELLRRIKGDRRRLEGCQNAVRDQYAFLADFLQDLSGELAMKKSRRPIRFRPEVASASRSHLEDNGDVCLWFQGPGSEFYILLCDGMGTGEGAARESRDAAALLQQMLTAGFPAEYALRSLNSLAVLRDLGGCTTVDLVRLQLDTGRGTVYKWGAAPSYLLKEGQLRKIGTAGPPPGLSGQDREMVDRLSLGGGEVLILLSDGAGVDNLLRGGWTAPMPPPGELAAAIVEHGAQEGDDATVAVVRLVPSSDASA